VSESESALFSDNKEYDEIMSIRLWNKINKEEELLEFDFR